MYHMCIMGLMLCCLEHFVLYVGFLANQSDANYFNFAKHALNCKKKLQWTFVDNYLQKHVSLSQPIFYHYQMYVLYNQM